MFLCVFFIFYLKLFQVRIDPVSLGQLVVDYHVLPSLGSLVAPIIGLGITTVLSGFSPEAQIVAIETALVSLISYIHVIYMSFTCFVKVIYI